MSDERTCGTCGWWSSIGYPRQLARECLLFGDNRTSDMPEPLLFPFGGAGASRTGIETLPDFGCVQWAAQAATAPEGDQIPVCQDCGMRHAPEDKAACIEGHGEP